MPTRIFSSFEAFFDANRHANARATLLGRQRENWVLTHLAVNNSSVQWGQAGTKAVLVGAAMPGGVTIFIPTARAIGNVRQWAQV